MPRETNDDLSFTAADALLPRTEIAFKLGDLAFNLLVRKFGRVGGEFERQNNHHPNVATGERLVMLRLCDEMAWKGDPDVGSSDVCTNDRLCTGVCCF